MAKENKHTMIAYYRIGTPIRAYEEPRLYAATPDRKLAKKFESQRNMNFFIRKELYVDSIMEFEDRYRPVILHMATFETLNQEPSLKQTSLVKIPCTYEEEEKVFIQTDHVFYELGKGASKFYRIFPYLNPIVKTALDIFHTPQIFRFYTSTFRDPNLTVEEQLFSGFDGFAVLEDYDMKVDQLGLFLHFYGDTFQTD